MRLAVLGRLDRYAVTAAMIVSKPVLDDDAEARLNEALTSNLWPTRPNDNVSHYQIEIDRHLPGNETKRTGKTERLPDGVWAMMSLAYPNGDVRWVGVDELNWLAFLARPPQSLPARARQVLQDSIDNAQVESEVHGDKSTIVIRWSDLTPEPQAAKPLLHSWFELGLDPQIRAVRTLPHALHPGRLTTLPSQRTAPPHNSRPTVRHMRLPRDVAQCFVLERYDEREVSTRCSGLRHDSACRLVDSAVSSEG